jgi:hypothetical protein
MAATTRLQFKTAPVMLAGWPGMGNVGMMVIDHLRQKLGAEPFAMMDMRPFVAPAGAPVKDGKILPLEMPRSSFSFRTNPDMIFFDSNTQVGGKEGPFYVQNILDYARQLGVAKIYTIAAFPTPMSHSDEPRLYYATNSDTVGQNLQRQGLEPLPSGEIAGAAGLLTTMASSEQLESACIIAPIPLYAASFSYPRAALEILESLEELLHFDIDLSELRDIVDQMDAMFEQMEEQLRDQFPSMFGGEQDMSMFPESARLEMQQEQEGEEEAVPPEVRERIEQLFGQAAHDRARALQLKKELDRWQLYAEYEDRFLDLFKSER